MAKFGPDDLSGWLALLPLFMQLIDFIVGMVERLFGKKTGEEKKAVAMKVARSVIPDLETGIPVPQDVLSKMIDNQVALNNEAGTFIHSGGPSGPGEPQSLYGA
jgi:hypothetical protein